MKEFKNKVIVITGAASGIGRALAINLSLKGAIVVGADIDKVGLIKTKEILKENGIQMYYNVYDVSQETEVQAFRDIVIEQFGHIDALINNAGVLLQANDFRDISQADWEWIFKVNFWSVLYHTRAFLPALLTRSEASITNVSSVYGLMGMPEYAPYCSSKFAVKGFSESLHVELLNSPVCVTCVYPAGVKTNIINNSKTYSTIATAKEAAVFANKLAKVSPGDAARIIVSGIQKKRSRVLVGKDAKILDFFVRWMPKLRIPLIKKFTRLYNRRNMS